MLMTVILSFDKFVVLSAHSATSPNCLKMDLCICRHSTHYTLPSLPISFLQPKWIKLSSSFDWFFVLPSKSNKSCAKLANDQRINVLTFAYWHLKPSAYLGENTSHTVNLERTHINSPQQIIRQPLIDSPPWSQKEMVKLKYELLWFDIISTIFIRNFNSWIHIPKLIK